MRRLLWTGVVIGTWLWAALPAQAALDAGTNSALYLGTGAKAIATGRAAVTDGSAAAVDWNPAGLDQVPRTEFLAQHAALFGDASQDTLAVAYPMLDAGTLALGWMQVQANDVQGMDENNLPDGTFGYREQELLLAYGRKFWGPLALGAAFKLHDLRIAGAESWSPGLNLGAQTVFPTPFSGAADKSSTIVQELRFGAAVRDAVGPLLKLQDEAERLSPTYRFGTAILVGPLVPELRDALTLKLDVEKPELADWRWHMGAEYALVEHFAVRGGWDQEYFSAGVGLAFAGLTLDYAVSFPALGLRHVVSVSYAFGEDLRDVRARRQSEQDRLRQAVVDKLKQEIILGYDQQARQFAAAGKYPEAVKLWEKVLDWDPNNAETQANLNLARDQVRKQQIIDLLAEGEKAFGEERYVDTMLACKQVQELDPKNSRAAELYTRAENQATSLGEMAFAKEVKAMARVRQHYLDGLKAYARQDWGTAIQQWELVLTDSPLQKQVFMYLDKARARYDKSRQGQGGQVSVSEQKRVDLYKQAVNLSRAGKLKDAALTWEKIITDNPEDTDAKANLDKTRKEYINSEKKGIRW